MANAREAVLKGLCRIEEKGEYSNRVLTDILSNPDFSALDRGFITELLMGVVRNQLRLDYVIQKFSKLKLKKLSVSVHQLLKIGIYQILFMDSVPDSAACNESVKLANKYANQGARGYINGVLRSVSRGKEKIEYPKDPIENLSILYSYPLWLTKKIVSQYGIDVAERIIKDSHEKHLPTIRVNRLKTTVDELIKLLDVEGISTISSQQPWCLKVTSPINIRKSKAYADGLYSLQGISSMMAVDALDPKPNEVIFDLCAAPGGKTTQIGEIIGSKGKIYAFDIHNHKIDLIKAAANRLGIDCIETSVADSSVYNENFKELADRILVDAPCSGIGIIHKKPDIKWNRLENDIEELSNIQLKILENSSKYLKSNGVLLYSTCTILKEENQDIVAKFLKNNKNFKLIYDKQIQTYENGGNGFYIAKLIRES